MGIDSWLTAKSVHYNKPLCMDEYPGYTHGIILCESCNQEFEGLFKNALDNISCPKCKTPGVKVVKTIRKIYLQ